MTDFATITITLSGEEMQCLKKVAGRNLRTPRLQACYMVLSGLGLIADVPPTKEKSNVQYREDEHAAFA